MSRPYIIISGLPPHHPHVPAELRETVRASLEKTVEDMDAAGYEAQILYAAPEPGGLVEFVASLKARKPDGVVIAWVVRGNKELSSLFEDMVNAVVEHAPGAKLMFNTSLEDWLEHVKRFFPVK